MATTTRRLSKSRIRLFRVIAFTLPLLLLLVMELSLRLFHYGYDTALFIEVPGNKDYLEFNPNASKKYFTDQLNATTGNREPFRKVKEPGTLRIFVLGESTTIGYPYFHNGSFHRWLQYRLMRSFPDKKLEIVNLSLTAVNSYTVLGFARSVVHYEPDAILIYTGHNEYYGALGVGSTNRLGGSPWLVNTLLWFRQLRFVQLLTRTYGRIAQVFSSGSSKNGRTRMELMVADQEIAYGSPLFTRGIRQFKTNMDETLDIFHRNKIPVFISNIVSNLRDQHPFISISGKAAADYTLGRQAWDKNDFATAKTDFLRAKEMDALRFRAPEQINDIIATLSRKYDNTHLVDTRAAFETASDHGIIGSSLLLEHVHPNLLGYALLSDVFYHALQQQGLIPVAREKEWSLTRLLAEMPITRVDSLSGAYKIANLERNWPFSDSGHASGPPSRDGLKLSTEEEDLAYAVAFEHLSWEEAMRQLYDYYSKTEDWSKAAEVMEALCLEHPAETTWYDKTAMLYGKLKDNEKAIFYFGQAFNQQPGFERARYLFVLCLQADRPADAMPYLDYAIANNTAGMNLQPVKVATEKIIQLEQQVGNDNANTNTPGTNPANTPLLLQISQLYQQMGNKPAALKYASLAKGQ